MIPIGEYLSASQHLVLQHQRLAVIPPECSLSPNVKMPHIKPCISHGHIIPTPRPCCILPLRLSWVPWPTTTFAALITLPLIARKKIYLIGSRKGAAFEIAGETQTTWSHDKPMWAEVSREFYWFWLLGRFQGFSSLIWFGTWSISLLSYKCDL